MLSGETRVEALDDGCVCCSLADSLRPGIERLIETTPAEAFVLETTGLADPMNVMYELLALNDLVDRGLLITIVDGWDLAHGDIDRMLDPEDAAGSVRLRQILNADVVVMSKADAADPEGLEAVAGRLHELNPDALIISAAHGSIPFALLDACYLHWLDVRSREAKRMHRAGSQAPAKLPSRESPRLPEAALGAKAGGGRSIDSETSQALKLGRFGGGKHFGPAGSSGAHGALGAFAGSDADRAAAQQFETRTVQFVDEIELDEVKALVLSAGRGLVRAKGIALLKGEGPVLIHWAAGVLSCEPAQDSAVEAAGRAGFWAASEKQPDDGGSARGFLVLISRWDAGSFRGEQAGLSKCAPQNNVFCNKIWQFSYGN